MGDGIYQMISSYVSDAQEVVRVKTGREGVISCNEQEPAASREGAQVHTHVTAMCLYLGKFSHKKRVCDS
jgi:hypothetical protein